MRRIPLLLLLVISVYAEEGGDGTDKPALMQRLVQSLPQIPNVIKGQMEGKPDELKKMVSSMLGDGLLSQLVVNPLGVAENMGVPLHDLGINKTVLDKSMSLNGSNETSGAGAAFNFLNAFYSSTQAPTTQAKKMFVDGVEVKDWDRYARKYKLENLGYSTLAPPTTTTQLSPENVADVVLQRLRERDSVTDVPRSNPDISNSLDMNLIDPRRVAEVNSLLRRSPQRFESPAPSMNSMGAMDIGPPGFVQSLDPAIDEVVTNLRTKGAYGLNVDDVKRLQNILQTYEQTLQTKELLSRRKQLEVLQTELTEQRKRIEVQKKMEEELRKKEKELEEAKQKMEQQLREQLSSWHSSFGPSQPRAPVALPAELQLENLGSPPAPPAPIAKEVVTTTERAMPSFEISSHESLLAEERENIVEQQMMPVPPPTKISSSLRNHIRYSPTPVVTEATPVIPPSTSVDREDDEFVSKCNCEKISLDKMDGKWLLALASPNVIDTLQQKTNDLVGKSEPITCSRFDVSAGKQSVAAQDARLIWQFRTGTASKLNRLRGSALTMDHESVRVQMTDFHGDNFSFPFCVLRSGGNSTSYEHLLVTNSQGTCKDVALLIRHPQQFFDNPDKELRKYLKSKISKKEMNALNVITFGDC
ncbi:hypothetical protein GCK72_025776 [Caenorhabditis remanei]|uniref:Uncharacterized protein n=1 Tax=Caenorhabditis remanei TaxID=31234 RepID=A0A6A5G487_CAERE|nr:hypothetical protein GCK72_025776 [Caenorhabditis remanei]KAF1749309.1 hypothetical protein GCK72_025776 [Caenorhabditis remanei]